MDDCYRGPIVDYHCHDILTLRDDRKAWKKLVAATCLCFIFMVAEIVGGYLAGSLAVMTDAAHLFSDFVGFNISLLAIWIGKKSATKLMTFGYHRAEVLGALISVITVWLLAVLFAGLAVRRLVIKEYDIDADTMIIVASIGLAINIGMGAVLHGVCHTHSHGMSTPSHSHTSNENINVRAAAAHVLGDMLQSVGVLIAAIIIKLNPDAKIADPICTLIFSIIVIFTTGKVAKDSVWYLMEGSPVNTADMMVKLKALPEVKHVHSLHVWSLSPAKDAVAVHLAVGPFCDRDVVLEKASSVIKSQTNVVSCTIQVENYNHDQINRCSKCLSVEC
ncbi:zinc transporter 2 isoform X2 [Aethina tumida]|uniref:zinc transporter 2 isoform X2 n=1 Tax=Aethina tumida TaxID=116153 RepID=UPI00096B0F79|nr:zinc transporter 2 isoform X2 [Aethina tumida]